YIENGYWYIDGVNTGVKAEGIDGNDGNNGEDGKTPYIENGYWYIDGVNTGVKAEGIDGNDGNNGEDGKTPYIENGYWYIDGVNTGVKAEGIDGNDGDNGKDSATIESVTINSDGKLVIRMSDGREFLIDMPQSEAHTHTWGALQDFEGNDGRQCQSRIYFQVCSECFEIKWIYGKESDHILSTEYSYDNGTHWLTCERCSAFVAHESHTSDDGVSCKICSYLMSPTEGIVYTVNQNHAEVTDYTGTASKIRIADSYEGYPVTKIATQAFQGKNISDVIFPDTITTIGDYAFAGCSSLKGISLPSSVTRIEAYAFSESGITEIKLGDNLEYIGEYAFRYCDFSEFSIPDSVTYIGGYAFSGCWTLRDNGTVNGVIYVDNWAVDSKDEYASITLLDGTVGIAESAFSYDTKMESLFIPDSVRYIANSAFNSCTHLESIKGGEGVTVIGASAFYGCIDLTSITVWDNVVTVGSKAFYGCRGATDITVGESVTEIGNYAFYCCNNMTSVTIGAMVSSIGANAFDICTALTSVYFNGASNTWSNIIIYSGNDALSGATVYFYSEEKPTAAGSYWHYVDGVPTAW
ncbi:MAG: leucine-rich repeat protein, partial [Clostridia bacterium]|nr:leucine-rich repeat protein [Clostridia bacterium]